MKRKSDKKGKEEVDKIRKEAVNETRVEKTSIRFEENGNVVEMETEGQATEFLSDEEREGHSVVTDYESENGEEGEILDYEDVEDDEIIFTTNNNASILRNDDSEARQVVAPNEIQANVSTKAAKISKEMEREERIVNKTVERLQVLMAQSGYFNTQATTTVVEETQKPTSTNKGRVNDPAEKGKILNRGNDGAPVVIDSPSESTVYQTVIQPNQALENKRDSSSSDDNVINTSDETVSPERMDNRDLIEHFIAECRVNEEQKRNDRPSTSKVANHGTGRETMKTVGNQEYRLPAPTMTADERAAQLIRQSEASKAWMVDLPGNINVNQLLEMSQVIDEDFCLVAAHVDEGLKRRIEQGDYADFARLILQECSEEEDGRLELIYKQDAAYWLPAVNQNYSEINSFARWEQAFRVFADIYTRANPGRVPELIQYNHLISTAVLTFSWENVYTYDRDFRRHMSCHLNRSWAIILQQAWTV